MNLFLITLLALSIAMSALWLLSLAVKDASIVDIFWGLGFVLIAAASYLVSAGFPGRKQLLLLLVIIWGLRLALYLAWRNLGKGEDFRYQAMRKKYGPGFSLISLFLVFGLQGALMWIISLPLQAAQLSPAPGRLIWLDWLGVILWLVGFGFEAIGDWQLARFKSNSKNKGKVLNQGLWALTRHPNYFGDALLWWGYFSIACAAGAWWTIISPVLMTLLLLKVSGVALLEKSLSKTKPEYQDYVQRTNAFFPWFPKRRTNLM